jgi:hypothetical protein
LPLVSFLHFTFSLLLAPGKLWYLTFLHEGWV